MLKSCDGDLNVEWAGVFAIKINAQGATKNPPIQTEPSANKTKAQREVNLSGAAYFYECPWERINHKAHSFERFQPLLIAMSHNNKTASIPAPTLWILFADFCINVWHRIEIRAHLIKFGGAESRA